MSDAGFIVSVIGFGYVLLLGEVRIGSVGKWPWRGLHDPARLARYSEDRWLLLPLGVLLALVMLSASWPWCGFLALPTCLLTHRFARAHESPVRRARREREESGMTPARRTDV